MTTIKIKQKNEKKILKKELQKIVFVNKIATKAQNIQDKIACTIGNSTKSFEDAIKKAGFPKSPFCGTKLTKKADNNLNWLKFSICRKKTGLNWNITPGLCCLKPGAYSNLK